ncbi:hypothetical protein ACFE04_004052 [Oxalis oulophora]
MKNVFEFRQPKFTTAHVGMYFLASLGTASPPPSKVVKTFLQRARLLVPLKREKYLLTVYIYEQHLLRGFEEESDLRKRLDLLKVPKKITQIRCEENCPRAKSGRELVKNVLAL